VSTLFTGIGSLALTGERFGEVEMVENAALAVSGGKVIYSGSAAGAPVCDETVDVDGRSVIPGFVDSHSHLMFAGERSEEFSSRITGKPYAAGGIRTTVKATRSASDDELRENAKSLINEFYASGITQFEIKSGYGLDVETEVRSLKIASELELGCASVDHCTHLSPEDITLLSGSETVVTLLPGAEFSTKSPYPDGRRLASAGITLAIATDCNPGSSYTTSMPFCIAIAVREMGLSPDQALWAATRGGAKALRTNGGSLQVGERADFVVLDAPTHIYLSYRPGVQLVSATYVGGKKVFERN